ncbi:MAG: hypothetical protein QNJ98_09045 [Planctomycetota bacterium]|nr:hypothetical protein [Planctomycetota bacterium]
MPVDDPPPPELFVARDRARRFARRLRDALSERRLSYRGDKVGMETLVDHADENLVNVLEDIAQTVADVEARRIRDRERGYMEVPLLVAADGIALRLETARRIERARGLHEAPDAEAQAAVLELMEDALARIDRYCAAYDEKQPVGPARPVALDRVLRRLEQAHGIAHPAGGAGADAAAYDREPPPVASDAAVLDDLLRAARAAVPDAKGPWQVVPATPERPLALALGKASAQAELLESPDALHRAATVLQALHPVTVRCLGRRAPPPADAGLLSEAEAPAPDVVERIELELADAAAQGLDAVVRAAAGAEAKLTADAEKAVRALVEAPPVPAEGLPPPARMVALLGLVRAVDAEVVRTLLPRASTAACRVAASQVPREKTRKAPVKRDLLLVLENEFADFPAHRVDDVAQAAADGKLSAKHMRPMDAAALLAVLGRTWRYAGQHIRRALDLEPLTDADIEELIGALAELAVVRRALEGGQAVEPAGIATLERAGVAILGRLGRLA